MKIDATEVETRDETERRRRRRRESVITESVDKKRGARVLC